MRFWSALIKRRLTGKLLLLFLAAGLLFVVLVVTGIGRFFSYHFDLNIRPHLIQYAEYVRQDIGNPPDRVRAAELAERLNVDIYFQESGGTWSSSGKQLNVQALEIKKRLIHKQVEYGVADGEEDEYFWANLGDTTVYLGIPEARPDYAGRGFFHLILPLLILVLLYHLIMRLIGPVKTLAEGVKRFGDGELSHRIELKRNDELGELAGNFNNMASDIEQMLDSKRQLLLAISHELRSPLTRAKVSLELMDESETKSELEQDLDEMARLIEELLETERLSSSHQALNLQTFDLVELARDIVKERFPTPALSCELPVQPIKMNLDVPRIKLLIKNLLDNAVRHSEGTDKVPELKLMDKGTRVEVIVSDWGAGIEPEHLPHLMEPFYRADASRRRETGGYGLGLYLCKRVAELHGGDLSITSELGVGTRVTVELPLQHDTP